MPNKKKKYNARFPPARIKKIMQTDEEVGKVAAAVPVIISRALELFVESLIRKTSQVTQSRNAKTLTTSHLKQCILSENQFDFLKDLVASVPDVQADDDSSNPLSSGDITKVSHLRTKRQRGPRMRKYSDNNAGPSHTGTEDDSDDEEDEEDEDDDDDNEDDVEEDETRSEDGLLHNKQFPCFNHQGFPNNVYGKLPHNGTPPSTTKDQAPFNFISGKVAVPLDEDYDS